MRNHFFRKNWLLVALATVSLASALWAQDQGPEFHWQGKLKANQVVEIKNINGDIDAKSTSGDEVQVRAEKSGPQADQIKIEVVPSSEGVTICAVYPSSFFGGSSSGKCDSGNHWNSSNVHGERTKVHFTVLVPKNVRFSGMNVNGGINAEDMTREVRANTVNGSVQVSTSSWAEVNTVNGSVHASMGDAAWNGTLKIASVNGAIELRMPDDLNCNVSFKSVNGNMSSDFPLTISNNWPVGHSAKGQIGSGGRELVIETVNGGVQLRKGGAGI
jgi:Putative adhesin